MTTSKRRKGGEIEELPQDLTDTNENEDLIRMHDFNTWNLSNF